MNDAERAEARALIAQVEADDPGFLDSLRDLNVEQLEALTVALDAHADQLDAGLRDAAS